MKLDNYLRSYGLTSARFGELSGIGSKQAVHKYRHGLRFPTAENLRRIREATNGAVTAEDFVDQHVGASDQATGSTPTSVPGSRKRRPKWSAPDPEPGPPPHDKAG